MFNSQCQLSNPFIVAKKQNNDATTEMRIKEAARKVFHQKGYASTRTRDIAEEADINLALLNYYFRSKEKLFQVIMIESLQHFFQSIAVLLNDESTSFETKVEQVVANYIIQFQKEPLLPGFVLSEIRNHPDLILDRLPVKQLVLQSVFAKQYEAYHQKFGTGNLPFVSFLMNLMGLTIFPFITAPVLKGGLGIQQKEFDQLMNERKKLIPVWIKLITTTP